MVGVNQMTHKEVLNKLLAHSCGHLTDEELKKNGGVQKYTIELHCMSFTVEAKYLGNFKFKIVSMSMEEQIDNCCYLESPFTTVS